MSVVDGKFQDAVIQ